MADLDSAPHGAAGAGPGQDGQYQQELHRSIGVLGNIFITLSGVTPASSVFIIVPIAIIGVGSGSFIAFLIAGIIGVFMAFCWAELGSAFPIAGGDYALVWHSFKGKASWLAGPVSFITFLLYLSFIAFIPAVIALGTGTYLSVVWDVNPKVIGAVCVVIATIIAIFNIKLNSYITGIFLAIELAAMVILTVLGFAHAHNWSALLHPVMGGSGGDTTQSVSFSAVLAMTAVAVFAYNGYANAVNFAEETKGPRRNIARAILISLLITVAAELIPTTAMIVGAPSLAEFTTATVPNQYFIESTSNDTINTIVSLGIVIAILNAVIAIILSYARIIYSSARDRAWPEPINTYFASVSKRFGSPVIPTVVIGVVSAILCLTVSETTLTNLTGASLVVDYALIAIAAIVARAMGVTKNAPYKMPLWPLWPVLALAALAYVFTQQTAMLLTVTLITMAIGLVYWFFYVHLYKKGTVWNLKEATIDADHE